ncbi:nuclear transport factor 2 family protein [Loktanella sp. IMCC34160]|uniref:nuclear transport factor 2 family protein n=1 Tax=Loktanella sp. IMCC34160 TaxID=2510646 RepID=UPI00101C7563|nr:nuclear transport factor 2 family protein [Loktanella sp. IMCC34160]RYG89296.1 nuclear transport factor 2 family protein [Loktanella sp. IMCC34160]
MTDLQGAKDLVRHMHAVADAAPAGETAESLSAVLAPDHLWRGYHPFGELHGVDALGRVFWDPLKTALTRLQRREDIFFAGRNELDGYDSTWVVSMGHLMGLLDQPWLGIRPTAKMAFLRYCAFYRVEGGKITETAMYFDIPHLMTQAGQCPFPSQTAAHLVQPGPITHSGLLYAAQPEAEGKATLAAINAMISDLGQWKLGLPLEEELARTWQDDMIWWGPEGIGATYTIERYAKQHSGPFRAGFGQRSKTKHIARLAEGHFGGFFGWPNFTAVPTGGFMGLPGSDIPSEFRVIDIYRRAGDKLAENWVFIDLLHFWKMQGRDFLKDTTGYSHEN